MSKQEVASAVQTCRVCGRKVTLYQHYSYLGQGWRGKCACGLSYVFVKAARR